jgi:hypothetical protein
VLRLGPRSNRDINETEGKDKVLRWVMLPVYVVYGVVRTAWDIVATVALVVALPFLLLWKSLFQRDE